MKKLVGKFELNPRGRLIWVWLKLVDRLKGAFFMSDIKGFDCQHSVTTQTKDGRPVIWRGFQIPSMQLFQVRS